MGKIFYICHLCDGNVMMKCWYFLFFTRYFPFAWFQILYKSKCDNRLNEITERVSGDRREVSPVVICLFAIHVFVIILLLVGPTGERSISGRVAGKEVWGEIQAVWRCSLQTNSGRVHISWYSGNFGSVLGMNVFSSMESVEVSLLLFLASVIAV